LGTRAKMLVKTVLGATILKATNIEAKVNNLPSLYPHDRPPLALALRVFVGCVFVCVCDLVCVSAPQALPYKGV
jgi:hypothetical protein